MMFQSKMYKSKLHCIIILFYHFQNVSNGNSTLQSPVVPMFQIYSFILNCKCKSVRFVNVSTGAIHLFLLCAFLIARSHDYTILASHCQSQNKMKQASDPKNRNYQYVKSTVNPQQRVNTIIIRHGWKRGNNSAQISNE